jgi:F-type H+-transporting ATPase subunit delta
MSVSKIAYRYGKSLLDLAQQMNTLEGVVADMGMFQEVLENRDFVNLINSPIVKSDKKIKVFESIFGSHITDLTKKYFTLIIQKGREPLLPQIATSFIEQYKGLQNISTVTLTSAREIDGKLLEEIKDKLAASAVTNEKVELDVQIDPSLMGGFVLEFDGQKYDESIKTKLSELRKQF